MVAIGLILLIAAVAGSAVLVGQTAPVRRCKCTLSNHTWVLDPYGILAAGPCHALITVVGVALMHAGTAHTSRLCRERNQQLADNDRLYGRPAGFSMFFGDEDEDARPQTTTTRPGDAARSAALVRKA